MTLDPGWSMQAVTALDLSAMSAAESIVTSGQGTERTEATVHDDYMGGTKVPVADVTELTTGKIFDSEGPAMPLHVSGSTDYESGLIRPVAGTAEFTAAGQYSDSMVTNQLDQAFSANIAAMNYNDQQYQGRIVDYTA